MLLWHDNTIAKLAAALHSLSATRTDLRLTGQDLDCHKTCTALRNGTHVNLHLQKVFKLVFFPHLESNNPSTLFGAAAVLNAKLTVDLGGPAQLVVFAGGLCLHHIDDEHCRPLQEVHEGLLVLQGPGFRGCH